MKIEIYTPFGYNELGGRANNEDAIYPELGSANAADRVFLVCDGVGGAEKGEIASQIACESFAEFFKQNNITYSNKAIIAQAVDFAEQRFDEFIAKNHESKGMGTTVTLIHIHENGITVAHIGDSRIYQVRNGQIIHQSKDHSLAMELFSSGIITLEQARQHPRRNEITRALQGKSVRNTKAEVSVITDIKAGDYFFLCTDGVLEHVDENILEDTIKQFDDPENIIQVFKGISLDRTKDNFSAYLVKIKEVIGNEEPITVIEETQNIVEEQPNVVPEKTPEVTFVETPVVQNEIAPPDNDITVPIYPKKNIYKPKKKDNSLTMIIIGLLALGLIGGGYWAYTKDGTTLLKNEKKQPEVAPKLDKQLQEDISKKEKKEKKKDSIKTKEILNQNEDLKGRIPIELGNSEEKETPEKTDNISKSIGKKNIGTKWGPALLEKREGKYGIISNDNIVRVPFEYQEIQRFKNVDKFHLVKKDSKYGFIIPQTNGYKLITPKYKKVTFLVNTDKAKVVDENNQETILDLRDELKKYGKDL